MARSDEVQSVHAELASLSERAEEHFAKALTMARRHPEAEHYSPSIVATNWVQYGPAEIFAEGDAIGRQIPRMSSKLAGLLRRSPLLTEADLRDLTRRTKAMMAALRFRHHREWDTQILHDEDVVLGTTPAGQDDSEPLSIDAARESFRAAVAEMNRLLEFLTTEDEDLPAAIAATRVPSVVRFQPDTAFIMMWIDPSRPELEDAKEAIKEEFKRFGIVATRSDEIEHQGVITERILNEIAASEFLLADLTGERPSVYYEVGYAHAIGKRPILFRRSGTALHFDLSVHNCPEYENITDLRARLRKRLEVLTNRQVQE